MMGGNVAFDFETGVDRRGSDAMKWQRYAGRDVLPMWVADMDFAAPPAVLEALHRRIDHGVLGYAKPWPSLMDAVTGHLLRHYLWQVDPDWIVWIPGVVAAFNAACRAVGASERGIFTATPVYPPFLSAPRHAEQTLVTTPLLRDERRWAWDFDQVAARLAETRPGLWLLCHPHNPVGRVWRQDELEAISALAEAQDMVICSDEIHCGLVLDEQLQHRPLASLNPALSERTITLMAPSKTFNIPGLYSAFAVIANPVLRRRFQRVLDGIMPHINTLGLVATEVAYRDCDDWHAALIQRLRENASKVEQAVASMPGLQMTPVEATYLAWIDCRGAMAQWGGEDPAIRFERAGVGLSSGRDFAPGTGANNEARHFVRLNFGCAPDLLNEALRRMQRAVDSAF